MTPQRGTNVEHLSPTRRLQPSDLRIRDRKTDQLKDYESGLSGMSLTRTNAMRHSPDFLAGVDNGLEWP